MNSEMQVRSNLERAKKVHCKRYIVTYREAKGTWTRKSNLARDGRIHRLKEVTYREVKVYGLGEVIYQEVEGTLTRRSILLTDGRYMNSKK